MHYKRAKRGSSEEDLIEFSWFPPRLELRCGKARLRKKVCHMPQVNMGLSWNLGETKRNIYERVSGKFKGHAT